MKEVWIALNGGEYPSPLPQLNSSTTVYAVDGGANMLLSAGVTPHCVIGDGDSIHSTSAKKLIELDVKFHKFPVDKDFTDFELALELALKEHGPSFDLVVLGALGGEHDFTFGNVFALLHPELASVNKQLLSAKSKSWVLGANNSLLISGTPGTTISVVPLSAESSISLDSGFIWPLQNKSIQMHQCMTLRNRLAKDSGNVTIHAGSVLLMQHHRNNDNASVGC